MNNKNFTHSALVHKIKARMAAAACLVRTILPVTGRKYKIRDENKQTVMIARRKEDGDCCDCTCEPSKSFFLSSLDEDIVAAQALCVVDSSNCCSYDQQVTEIVFAPLFACIVVITVPFSSFPKYVTTAFSWAVLFFSSVTCNESA